ncbi:protein WHAT'S THIS FACTOR 1 homolog, chloroplastic [Physcomitrium patens]|uniref:PORR domain-containing protein n=1 Tax=Physcomitrium patens TaxID=3218 RepID=A0A2K1K3Z6_PHYPA|nr:protein WHAT'S THIS FACTOR 1 homolog [Physcomitrium patens]PNR48501.1 hypothetical protein PHYPA_012978 [Physcomitrium patens]|eukprot:XP_024383654.1 protein WHAT'S THIS FACTOR 1 homolog [Physcomitrella patens]
MELHVASTLHGAMRMDRRSVSASFFAAPGVIAKRHSFFGCTQSLRCSLSSSSSSCSFSEQKCKNLVITAVIKRKKGYKLDSVIDGEKKLKHMIKIKEILVKQPGEIMSLQDLEKYWKYLGLKGKKKTLPLLHRFPAVFQVYEERDVEYLRFTSQYQMQYVKEKELLEEMEHIAVTKLRKLLMMSIDRSIAIPKIEHIRQQLGLPDDFATSDFLSRHSQYFKVGSCGLGPLLILEEWDSALAVTALEKSAQDNQKAREELEKKLARSLGEEIEMQESIFALTPRFQKKTLTLPGNQKIKKADMLKLLQFRELNAISPYKGIEKNNLKQGTPEAEKAAVLVVHELLSLTLDKKMALGHLSHFRRDFHLSQHIWGLLVRHPEYFYVSLKGNSNTVFLHEAYKNSELKEKDPLVSLRERMLDLVSIGRLRENLDSIMDGDGSEGEIEDEDDVDDDDDYDWDDNDDEYLFEQIRRASNGGSGDIE